MDRRTAADSSWQRWRVAVWAAIPALLAVPLLAMQFTGEVSWGAGDFLLAAALLVGAATTLELAARHSPRMAFRVAVVLAAAAVLLLIWVSGAVGIIGSENNAANRWYFGVIALALGGALAGRFRPAALASAMLAAGLAQAAIGTVALGAGWGSTSPAWPIDVLVLTLFFTALWLSSAWLFQRAAAARRDER